MNGKTGKVIHYTQMAWGGSTRIGCGYISFKDNTEPETPFRRVSIILHLVVSCNDKSNFHK